MYEDDNGNVTSLLGVITTFSYTFLLLSSFCCGALAYIQDGANRGRDPVAFWGVCSLVLFLAGLDERFLWHETVGYRLRIEDVWVAAIYPLLLLSAAWWGRHEVLRFRRNAWLGVPIVLGASASPPVHRRLLSRATPFSASGGRWRQDHCDFLYVSPLFQVLSR